MSQNATKVYENFSKILILGTIIAAAVVLLYVVDGNSALQSQDSEVLSSSVEDTDSSQVTPSQATRSGPPARGTVEGTVVSVTDGLLIIEGANGVHTVPYNLAYETTAHQATAEGAIEIQVDEIKPGSTVTALTLERDGEQTLLAILVHRTLSE